jgi:hypothetical protein
MKKKPQRILWNERDVDIDEIVIRGVDTVHVEQMDDRAWTIGIYREDGSFWMGTFVADSRGLMRFVEQESSVVWDQDEEHTDG